MCPRVPYPDEPPMAIPNPIHNVPRVHRCIVSNSGQNSSSRKASAALPAFSHVSAEGARHRGGFRKRSVPTFDSRDRLLIPLISRLIREKAGASENGTPARGNNGRGRGRCDLRHSRLQQGWERKSARIPGTGRDRHTGLQGVQEPAVLPSRRGKACEEGHQDP